MAGILNALNIMYHWAVGPAANTQQESYCNGGSLDYPLYYGRLKARMAVLHEDGRIVYANPSFCTYFGYEGASLENRNISEFIPNGTIDDQMDEEKCLGRFGQGHERKYVIASTSRLAQKILLEVYPSAEQLVEGLTAVAHDLRSPLNTIAALTDLLKEAKSEEERDLLFKKLKATRQVASNLCEDILLQYQIENGTIKINEDDFSVNELIDLLVDITKLSSDDKGLKFIFPQEDDLSLLFQVRGDSKRILSVMLNVLGNAVKYTQRGEIELSVHIEDDLQGKRLVFAVRDTGPGIAEENFEKIFEKASQLENGHSGIGFGLYSARRIAHLMRGDIKVQSRIEEGSTFTVEVPVQIASKAPSRSVTPDELAKTPSVEDFSTTPSPTLTPTLAPIAETELDTTKRILIVNDASANWKLLRMMCKNKLKYNESNIQIASSYAGAQELIDAQDFDVVLMDINLEPGAGGDGNNLARQIRRKEISSNRGRETIILRCSSDQLSGLNEDMDGATPWPMRGDQLKELLQTFPSLLKMENPGAAGPA